MDPTNQTDESSFANNTFSYNSSGQGTTTTGEAKRGGKLPQQESFISLPYMHNFQRSSKGRDAHLKFGHELDRLRYSDWKTNK